MIKISYESGKGKYYREYALIQGINLLVNMVEQIKIDKSTLQEIHDTWIDSGILRFRDQIDLIFGTASDSIKCRYMVYCINLLNDYMMSKYPNHRGLIMSLTSDVLSSINMAIFGSAHIWSKAQLDSIRAAFMSSHVAKSIPYYEPPEKEDEDKKREKRKVLEYKPD